MPHHPQDTHHYYAQTCINHGNTYRHPSDPQDNFIKMKIILKNQLAQAHMPNMPAGFPLHYAPDGHGSTILSEGSYEFRQNLSLSVYGEYVGHSSYLPVLTQSAIISFSDPYSSLHSGRDRGKYTWRISLPTFESTTHPDVRVVAAEVQVEMTIMRSAYGDRIRHDPRIISKALATSLEYGVKINIALADYTSITALTCQNKKNCILAPGDVVYFASDSNGQQQLLNVFDRVGYCPKFSSSLKFTSS